LKILDGEVDPPTPASTATPVSSFLSSLLSSFFFLFSSLCCTSSHILTIFNHLPYPLLPATCALPSFIGSIHRSLGHQTRSLLAIMSYLSNRPSNQDVIIVAGIEPRARPRQTTFLCALAFSISLVDPIFNTSSYVSSTYPAADVTHHGFLGGRCAQLNCYFLLLFLMVMFVFQSHLFFCTSFLLMLYSFLIWFNEIYSTHFVCYFKKENKCKN
jgi:hypothetical protein